MVGENEAVPIAPKASEAVDAILKTDAAGDNVPPTTSKRAAVFKEVILKGGQKALMRVRPRAVEIDPGRFSV
ncbi:hypothetical protein D3C85_1629300 [compost metagenome]